MTQGNKGRRGSNGTPYVKYVVLFRANSGSNPGGLAHGGLFNIAEF